MAFTFLIYLRLKIKLNDFNIQGRHAEQKCFPAAQDLATHAQSGEYNRSSQIAREGITALFVCSS